MVSPAPQRRSQVSSPARTKLVEKPGLRLAGGLGWTHADLFSEEPGPSINRPSILPRAGAARTPSRRAARRSAILAGRSVAAGRAYAHG